MVIGSCVAPISLLLQFYNQMKPVVSDIQSALPSYLKKSVVSTMQLDDIIKDNEFTARLVLGKRIGSIFERVKANGQYFIVYGAKGVGKSLLLDKASKDHIGVIKLMISYSTNIDDIVKSLAIECGISKSNIRVSDFVKALAHGAQGNKLMTVIFEVERGDGDEQVTGIQAARSLTKAFAIVCNCIIVLSEANAVLVFGNDSNREKFIYIDGFTEVEAREYLQRLKLSITESEINDVFSKIGTSPGMLMHMCYEIQFGNYTVEQFVKEVLDDADMDLLAFPLQPILKALKEHPEGVSPKFFNKVKYNGVDLSEPRAVGSAMKRSNAIVYRIENKKYQLLSKAHETALQTYEPIIVA
jgi:hypothetical protein